MTIPHAQSDPRSWRWFPWAIVAAFAVIVAVNGAAAYFALHSSPGLVTEHPFELGNGYNQVLAEGDAEDALGWRGEVSFAADGPSRGIVEVSLRDRSGQPLLGLAVKAELIRPVESAAPIPLLLSPTRPGRYATTVEHIRAGQWQVRVYAARDADRLVFARRIIVP